MIIFGCHNGLFHMQRDCLVMCLGVFQDSWHCLPKFCKATSSCSFFILTFSGINETGPAVWQFLTLPDQPNGLISFAFSVLTPYLLKSPYLPLCCVALRWREEIYLAVPMFAVTPISKVLHLIPRNMKTGRA